MRRPSPNPRTRRLPNDDDDAIASIGKLYGDDVLSILVDSDVYVPTTAKFMLEGKQWYENEQVQT